MPFWSDNTSPAAPEIMAALSQANEGYAQAYGADDWTARLDTAFAELFERSVTVFPLFTGTAANCLSMAQLAPPWGQVIAHAHAHILEDESTAPELLGGGARVTGLPGAQGKLQAAALAAFLKEAPFEFVHAPQPAALALTQATEMGTVYSVAEIEALCETAKSHGLAVMMDGARFANAVTHLGCSPAAITHEAGVDAVVFGATKNGALAAEALIFFHAEQAEHFAYRRKRSAHLLSKMRYVSAQLLASLEQDRWLKWAGQANAMAQALADIFDRTPGAELCHRPQANAVFVRLEKPLVDRIEAAGLGFYLWESLGPDAYRFVTSWCTQANDIKALETSLEAGV